MPKQSHILYEDDRLLETEAKHRSKAWADAYVGATAFISLPFAVFVWWVLTMDLPLTMSAAIYGVLIVAVVSWLYGFWGQGGVVIRAGVRPGVRWTDRILSLIPFVVWVVFGFFLVEPTPAYVTDTTLANQYELIRLVFLTLTGLALFSDLVGGTLLAGIIRKFMVQLLVANERPSKINVRRHTQIVEEVDVPGRASVRTSRATAATTRRTATKSAPKKAAPKTKTQSPQGRSTGQGQQPQVKLPPGGQVSVAAANGGNQTPPAPQQPQPPSQGPGQQPPTPPT